MTNKIIDERQAYFKIERTDCFSSSDNEGLIN